MLIRSPASADEHFSETLLHWDSVRCSFLKRFWDAASRVLDHIQVPFFVAVRSGHISTLSISVICGLVFCSLVSSYSFYRANADVIFHS